MNWYNFKQTIRKHLGMSFNYKYPEKVYYHDEWTKHNLDEINIKLSRLRDKLNARIKEFDRRR
tara:strand:+ start:385 stop:573 length:189 start_codon:yes stop_codon:yes gene_type:complete